MFGGGHRRRKSNPFPGTRVRLQTQCCSVREDVRRKAERNLGSAGWTARATVLSEHHCL